ncbi:hypothetical protein V8C86DRAFT_2930958 [Haematococcus lacustris]
MLPAGLAPPLEPPTPSPLPCQQPGAAPPLEITAAGPTRLPSQLLTSPGAPGPPAQQLPLEPAPQAGTSSTSSPSSPAPYTADLATGRQLQAAHHSTASTASTHGHHLPSPASFHPAPVPSCRAASMSTGGARDLQSLQTSSGLTLHHWPAAAAAAAPASMTTATSTSGYSCYEGEGGSSRGSDRGSRGLPAGKADWHQVSGNPLWQPCLEAEPSEVAATCFDAGPTWQPHT